MNAVPRRLLVLLLLVSLLFQPVGAWDQLRGGPHRNSVALLPGGPVDVLTSFDLTNPKEEFVSWSSPGLVSVGDDLFATAFEYDPIPARCSLLRIGEAEAGTAELVREGPDSWDCRPPPQGIPGGLQAHDRRANRLIGCGFGGWDDPVLWSIRPDGNRNQVTLTPREMKAPADSGVGKEYWYCSGVALDSPAASSSELIVPLVRVSDTPKTWTPVSHLIVALEVSSSSLTVKWSTEIPLTTFLVGDVVPVNQTGLRFAPRAATLTTSAVVVSGTLQCSSVSLLQACSQPTGSQGVMENAVAWLSRGGQVRGGATASGRLGEMAPLPGDRPILSGSAWAAAAGTTSGSKAVQALGGHLLVIDASSPDPRAIQISTDESLEDMLNWSAPAWSDETLVVPLPHSLKGYDAEDLSQEPWTWSAGAEWVVYDVVAADQGQVYALILKSSATTGHSEEAVVVLDSVSGVVAQRIPLPARPSVTGSAWAAKLVPLSEGRLLVENGDGTLILLGRAPSEKLPTLHVSTHYPGLGDAVELQLETPQGLTPARLELSWGQGSSQEFLWRCLTRVGEDSCAPSWDDASTPELENLNAFSHTYDSPGLFRLLATVYYSDATTGSALATIDVGGSPPPPDPPLNFMQRLFQNQDATWGILGLLIVFVSASYALYKRYRRHGKLDQELHALERIRAQSLQDPLGAIRSLELYRERLQDELAHRRLDDSQLGVLEARMARLFRGLSRRLLAPFKIKVSLGYQSLLESALEDGLVNQAEAEELKVRLKDEKHITRREKQEIIALINAWTWRGAETGAAKSLDAPMRASG